MVELIIVVAIVGVIVVIAVPQYRLFVERSRAREAISMLQTVKSAERVYKLEYTEYIGSVNYLVAVDEPSLKWWNFSIPSRTQTSVTVRATRTSADAGDTSHYIELEWDDSSGESWSGTHPGSPK